MNKPTEKECTKCLAIKSLGEFGKQSSNNDGVRGDCKKCSAENSRKHYYADPQERAERQRIYADAKREKIAEYKRKYAAGET